jgi:hypothetical protein
MQYDFQEMTANYWFKLAGNIYVTVSKREPHPILGEVWNVVGLDGRLTWLSESSIRYCEKA